MHCQHCTGIMSEAQFFDLEGAEGFMWMRGWQCRGCGHAINPLREASRRLRAVSQSALSHNGGRQLHEAMLPKQRLTREGGPMTTRKRVLLKLEGDWITWIEATQQAITAARHEMAETTEEVACVAYHDPPFPEPMLEDGMIACLGGYQRAA